MLPTELDRLKSIHDFPALVRYLKDDLQWPLDSDDIEDLTFDYTPEELGLEAQYAVKIQGIKQLRPLTDNQLWGIFFLEFEPERLPVVVLRRVLRALVFKKRQTAQASERAAWNKGDLLFISAMGEQSHRRVSFAHFADGAAGLPTLQAFDWDDRETQFHAINLALDKLKWPRNESDTAAWRESWAGAFTRTHGSIISTAKELSAALAILAGHTRDTVKKLYAVEAKTGPLHTLYEAFRKALAHDMEPDGFADTIAQTVAYGLFAARAETGRLLGLTNLAEMVPQTNPFLRDLFREIEKLGGESGGIDFDELGVSVLVEVLNKADMNEVLADFGRQTGGGREDPVIHFYEAFLTQYDKEQKISRGVFYTPKPVVTFIVRSVDAILREQFHCPDGLADISTWAEVAARNPGLQIPAGVEPSAPFVQILDPATGTGTFLETAIEVIYETLAAKWGKERKTPEQMRAAWNEYVPAHLLPRLHGFELMMASYAIAHVKLGLKLRQFGYDFQSGERLRVYLTNTLEPATQGDRQLAFLPEFLSHEAYAADAVKRDSPITVVIGNPPYSGISSNMNQWIDDLLHGQTAGGNKVANYYEVDGNPLGERKVWLQDDYVKFIRYGQHRIERASCGILAFITNHGYIGNPTFRGMRQSLMTTFNKIQIVDLHGNSKKKGIDGCEDNNVFDIQQGVSIGIFVSNKGTKDPISHIDLWGLRDTKYDWLLTHDFYQNASTELSAQSPHYLFNPFNTTYNEEYENCFRVVDYISVNCAGIISARDHFVIDPNHTDLRKRIMQFINVSISDDAIRDQYFSNREAGKYSKGDTRGWKLSIARQIAMKDTNKENNFKRCLYRPFDFRWIYYSPYMVDWPRTEVVGNMLMGRNIGLLWTRPMSPDFEFSTLVTREIVDQCTAGNKSAGAGITSLGPLYLYDEKGVTRRPNMNPEFLAAFGAKLGLAFRLSDTPKATPAAPDDIAAVELGMFGEYQGVFGHPAATGATAPPNESAFTPEDVFHYAYAVFHSPTYRARYAEFLKIDFPRLPLTSDVALFRKLCAFGAALVGLHLTETPLTPKAAFHGAGPAIVDALRYAEPGPAQTEGRVYINRTQYFAPVPPEVYGFHIGGYQVCHKWLKDRKGRVLTPEDISHYAYVTEALARTGDLMTQIDEAIEEHGGWPLG